MDYFICLLDNVGRTFWLKKAKEMSCKKDSSRIITKHHRRPKACGGKSGKKSGNISMVPNKKHKAFHTLFRVMTPPEIAQELTEIWIDPDWTMVAVPKKK